MKAREIDIKEAFTFAKAADCVSLALPRSKRAAWVKSREMYLGMTNEGERVMTPVKIKDREDHITYLMDVITGSLYDIESKACLTSDYLKLMSYKSDPDHGKKVVNMRGQRENNE